MNTLPHATRLAMAPLLLALPALTGCATLYGQAQVEQEAALRAEIAVMQERNRKLQGRLEGIELELERLQRSIESLQRAPAGPSAAEVQTLQARLAALDTQITSVDAAREKDRQEIINTLSTKISQLVGAQAAAARPKAVTPAAAKRSGPQEGYEHVVEPGQTLSAIAAAYGVSSKTIIDANNLAKPDQLRVGQKLFIPAP